MRWPVEPTGLPRGSGKSRAKRALTGPAGLRMTLACEIDGSLRQHTLQAVGSNHLQCVISTPLHVACNWTHDFVRRATKMARLGLLLLHTLSRLHKSRRVSNRCSFFAGAAGGIFIPRAQQ